MKRELVDAQGLVPHTSAEPRKRLNASFYVVPILISPLVGAPRPLTVMRDPLWDSRPRPTEAFADLDLPSHPGQAGRAAPDAPRIRSLLTFRVGLVRQIDSAYRPVPKSSQTPVFEVASATVIVERSLT